MLSELETASWREELRRQVEEDLERQVRLRLAVDKKPEEAAEGEEIWSALTHYGQWQSSAAQHLHDHPLVGECPQPNGSCEKTGNAQEVREGVVGSGQGQEEGEVVESGRKDAKRKAIGLGEKAELFLYLNKHHGSPLTQLRQLSSCGSFHTRAGAGEEGLPPDIQWPVEASIFLPTPHHIASPPVAQPPASFPAPEAQRVPSQLAEAAAVRGRLVYISGENCREGTGAMEDGQLLFESQFESGNLYQARQIGPHEYTLLLNPDLYSKRHVQWYYFRVLNMQTTPTYTFHIVNFEKSSSLYSEGLQPLLYSEHEARSTGMGWRRVGWNLAYHQSRVHYPPHMSPDRSYFTLSWSLQFGHHGDVCYLAHCYPYPLSALYRLLGNIEEDRDRAKYIQREELCQTLAGNSCPLLTVTDFTSECGGGGGKRGVVFTARVHPGETNSSWMMEGLLLFLTSDSPHAQALRQAFVFKLVPMLNPDGVVVGNYRTSLAGVDLNRMFRTPSATVFPTVYHTKKMMESFQLEREVCAYIDLHGHSRKHNVFMYGCHTPKVDHTHFLCERLIPFLLSEQAPDMFCLASCKFSVQRCKEATGRVVTWRSGVAHSFTLEATFCGSNLGPSRWQFTDRDLLQMGRNLGEAFYKFSKCLHSKTYQLKVMARLAEKLMNKLATPTDHTPCIDAGGVVTGTTSADLSPNRSERARTSHHQPKRWARQTLSKFQRLDIARLEQESSTSGSDSDNEDFKFRRKKKKRHRDRRQKKSTMDNWSQLPQLPPPSSLPQLPATLPHHSTRDWLPYNSTQEPELTLPSLLERATPTNQHSRASAPGRLQFHQSSGWRFVNRYRNRSSGGIPMFAEERLKERTEKRLRAMSETLHLPPAPSCPNMVAARTQETHLSHQTMASQPHPLWTNATLESDRLTHHSSPWQQHYQQIIELGHTYYHTPLQLMSARRAGHPSSPLPPQLLSFISRSWNKS